MLSRTFAATKIAFLGTALVACSSVAPPADAGTDALPPDAAPPVDAGPSDLGTDAPAPCVAPSGTYRVDLMPTTGVCALASVRSTVNRVAAGTVTWVGEPVYGCAGTSPDPTLTADCSLVFDVTCANTAYHWRVHGALHPNGSGGWVGQLNATTTGTPACDVASPAAVLTPI